MKKMLLIMMVVAVVSCGKKDSTTTTPPTTNITSITITADKTSTYADGFDEVVLTAKDQNGKDITSTSLFIAGSTGLLSNRLLYEYGQHGTYEVYCTNSNVTSNKITITVNNPGVSKYSTKVIAEDCTGAWCGWCPRLAYKFETFMTNNNRIMTIGVHNGDAYALSSTESSLRAKFGINSFPSAIINRDRIFNDNGNINNLGDSTDLGSYLRKRMVTGLSIASTLTGNSLAITTKVGFDANIKYNLNLTVMLVQDGIVLSQANYYNANNSYPANPYYSSGNPITSFVHKGVLRSVPSGIFGEAITASSQIKGGEYTKTHTVDITGMVAANVKVVAFVTYADGQNKTGILNAQWAAAGATKNYD